VADASIQVVRELLVHAEAMERSVEDMELEPVDARPAVVTMTLDSPKHRAAAYP